MATVTHTPTESVDCAPHEALPLSSSASPVRPFPWLWKMRLSPMARELLRVLPLYILLALVFTWPLVLNFNTCIVGDMQSDVWKHLWGMWWTKHKLIDENLLPVYTHLLNYPYGGALFFIDPLNGLLSVGLQYFFGMPTVFNIMVLFNIVLAAMGTYLLTRRFMHNCYGAFFAGCVYAYSTYLSAGIASGITESINIGWLPFFCYYFMLLFKRRTWQNAAAAALFFSLNTLGCWYYGAFAVLFAVFYYVYLLCCRYGRFWLQLLKPIFLGLLPSWSPIVTKFFLIVTPLVIMINRAADCAQALTVGCLSAADLLVFTIAPSLIVVTLITSLGNQDSEAPQRGRLMAYGWLASAALLTGLVMPLWNFCDFNWGSSALVRLVQFALAAGWIWGGTSLFAIVVRARQRQEPVKVSLRAAMVCAYSAIKRPFVVALGLFGLAFMGLILAGVRWGQQANSPFFVVLAGLAAGLASFYLARTLRSAACPDCSSLADRFQRFLAERYTATIITAWIAALGLAGGLWSYGASLLVLVWLATLGLLWIVTYLCARLWQDAQVFFQRDFSLDLACSLHHYWRYYFRMPLLMVVISACLIAGPVLAFSSTINSDASLVFRGRHEFNVDMHLSRSFMNVVNLNDFFLPGKERAIRSYTVDKLTRVCYIGWVTLAVIIYGWFFGPRRYQRRFWVFIMLVFMMFATGPFMYISENIYSTVKSPIYMAFFRYFPTFSLVSIPFRFTVLVMLAAAVLSAYALSDALRRLGRTEKCLITLSLVLALLFDVSLFSPAPFPMPLSDAVMPDYCAYIAADHRDGGVVDFPIQRHKGELLPGEYFYYQIGHMKDIPNRVEGTIPLFVYQNAFTNYLFVLEHAQLDMPPREKLLLEIGLEDLSRFRFRYIVVHDNYLRSNARARLHKLLRYYLGEPKSFASRVFVYKVPEYFRADEVREEQASDQLLPVGPPLPADFVELRRKAADAQP